MIKREEARNVPIIKIKKVDAEISDFTYDLIIDKVIIQGTINKEIYYVGIDNIVHYEIEDMAFSLFVDVIGALPGMSAEIDIDIEKIIAHISENGCQIRQKVLLSIFVRIYDSGSFVVENSKQLLVEGEFDICLPPVEDIIIEYEDIVRREEGIVSCQQVLIQNIIELEFTAEKVIDINVETADISADFINNSLLIVRGNIIKDIVYVAGNIVRHQNEIIPFNIPLDLPQGVQANNLNPEVLIEYLGFSLIEGGEELRQTIILKTCIRSDSINIIRVVSSIIGPEINTDTIMVEEEVLISQDPFLTEEKVFPVVITVNDPEEHLSVIEKDIVILNMLGQGLNPVEVIVFAE